LLCSLLASTGVAGRPESYFREPNEPMWAQQWRTRRHPDGSLDYTDYARGAVAAGSTPNGVFGCRVMWGTVEVMVDKLGVDHPHLAGRDLDLFREVFGPVRFVHLRRADTLAQAVSWARAEQTGYWQSGDGVLGEPRFDFAQIDQLVTTIDDHNRAWQDWFAASGIRPYEVSYEELIADMDGVTRAILHFLSLEVDGTWTAASPHGRQSDEVNADWIARYRAEAAN
jgi:LPS sulfotransferase NodH